MPMPPAQYQHLPTQLNISYASYSQETQKVASTIEKKW